MMRQAILSCRPGPQYQNLLPPPCLALPRSPWNPRGHCRITCCTRAMSERSEPTLRIEVSPESQSSHLFMDRGTRYACRSNCCTVRLIERDLGRLRRCLHLFLLPQPRSLPRRVQSRSTRLGRDESWRRGERRRSTNYSRGPGRSCRSRASRARRAASATSCTDRTSSSHTSSPSFVGFAPFLLSRFLFRLLCCLDDVYRAFSILLLPNPVH